MQNDPKRSPGSRGNGIASGLIDDRPQMISSRGGSSRDMVLMKKDISLIVQETAIDKQEIIKEAHSPIPIN